VLNVCFVLPSLIAYGEIRVVLEVAKRLRQYNICPSLSANPAYDPPLVDIPIYDRPLQSTDIVVATSWETVPIALEHEKVGYGLAAWYVQNWEAGWYGVETNPGIERLACCAEHLRQRIDREWGIDATVLPSGIDLDEFYLTPHGTCAPRVSRILIPWRDEAYKNPEGLKELVYAIKESGRQLVFMSPEMPKDQEFYDEFQQWWYVNPFREDIPWIYGVSDFVVSCSHLEGHSLITLEAIACGATPIVQEIGNKETIQGNWGVMLPPEAGVDDYLEAMIVYEEDRCNWSTKRSAGRRFIERFKWDYVAAQWVMALRSWSSHGEL